MDVTNWPSKFTTNEGNPTLTVINNTKTLVFDDLEYNKRVNLEVEHYSIAEKSVLYYKRKPCIITVSYTHLTLPTIYTV